MRQLLDASYWAQVNAMEEKRRAVYDRDLLAPERTAAERPLIDPGVAELMRLMRQGG